MGIDVRDYKMIYGKGVYDCLNIVPTFGEKDESGYNIPKKLSVVFIDDENRIRLIEDKADKFQFIRR